MSPLHSSPLRVLLVDDEESQLKLYSTLLIRHTGWRVEVSRFPTEALHLAARRLFDVIAIDATIPFNGTSFGGIDVYRQLSPRYGGDSLLVYSKFINEDLLSRYNAPFNFLEVGSDPIAFVELLSRRLLELRRKQRCFVAMPFQPSLLPLWTAIRKSVKVARYDPIRIDRQRINTSIIAEILRQIAEAKVVVFVTHSRNPNVFYEAGFAHALSKEILTLTEDYSTLPFDVRDRQAIAYGGDLMKLQTALTRKLQRLAY